FPASRLIITSSSPAEACNSSALRATCEDRRNPMVCLRSMVRDESEISPVRFEIAHDLRHARKVAAPRQNENSGAAQQLRRAQKVLLFQTHRGHEPGPPGVLPQQRRGLGDPETMDALPL